MKESKKIILEQGQNDNYKRIVIENNFEPDQISQTPQWDTMVNTLKEGTARHGTLFAESFFSGLYFAGLFGLILLIIVFIALC